MSGPIVAISLVTRQGAGEVDRAAAGGATRATDPAAGSDGTPGIAVGTTFAAALADAGSRVPAGTPAGTKAGTQLATAAEPATVSPSAATTPPAAGTPPAAITSPAVGTPPAGEAGVWVIPWAPGTAPVDAPAAGPAAASRGRAEVSPSLSVPTRALGAALTGPAEADALTVVVPLDGRRTQGFGPTTSVYSAAMTVDGVHYEHFHDGIDIAAPLGRPVRAMAAGEVEFAGRYPDGAEVVRIRHADGSVALYAHLKRDLDVKVGDLVAAGDPIGNVGMTGHTTGPHLHLELTVGGKPVDPSSAIESGRLPGAAGRSLEASVLRAPAAVATATDALVRFDLVSASIPHAAAIRGAAAAAGIDPFLLASLVKAESGFRADAVSSCGAMGLTQLMPATARSAHVTDPFDPVQNLRAGAKYLAGNLRIYGRVDLALAAYQAGKGAVAQAGGIPESPTTHRYIDRILQSWAGYLEATA